MATELEILAATVRGNAEAIAALQEELRRARVEREELRGELGAQASNTVAAVVEALELRGAPQGAWLLELDQVRASLATADELLRRMRAALIDQAGRLPSLSVGVELLASGMVLALAGSSLS